MELYDTEEQQIDAIKKWFGENGRSIVAGLVIGIGCIVGWNGWQSYKKAQAREASDLFQGMLLAVDQKKSDSLVKLGERIKENYASSPYLVFARFLLAKQNVESGNFAAAREELEAVLDESSDPLLKNIARLRLLRILIAEGKSDEVIQLIKGFDTSKSGKFENAYEELKGDAYLALGQEREARNAYKRATDLGRKSRFLSLKLEDLPVPSAPDATE